jgi:Ca2+-binding EF-hand superfamily protein
MALTNEQIQDAFTLFDVDRRGKISREDAEIAVRGLGFEFPKSHISTLVRASDQDNDGRLTEEEFVKLVRAHMPQPGSADEIWQAYKLFDTEQKGRITLTDLKKATQGGNNADGTPTYSIPEKDLQAIIHCGEFPEKGLAFSEWKHMMLTLSTKGNAAAGGGKDSGKSGKPSAGTPKANSKPKQ